ncbi:hypothetical protein [Pontimicrobium sp. MEBiC01747]
MNSIKHFNRIRWISKISFIIMFITERFHYSEGLPTEESTIFKYFKIGFLIVFIVTSIIENKLIIKAKDKEIESLKQQLYGKT